MTLGMVLLRALCIKAVPASTLRRREPHPTPCPHGCGEGARKGPPKPYATPDGIVKADWFLKHRQRRAAVALVLVPR